MKSCRDCGEIKDAAEFTVGRQCDECRSSYQSSWRRANLSNKAAHARQDRIKNAHKWEARTAVRKALTAGTLKRGRCSVCGTKDKLHAHHDSYEPEHHLNIVWMCEFHHTELHKMERRIKRALAKEEA